jgi:hypothetical protein
MRCLACNNKLAACLERAGSVRCHDCRDVSAPIKEGPMLSYNQGGFVFEFPECDRASFVSDLAKTLFGSRMFAPEAGELYGWFVAEHPGEVPVVVGTELLTQQQVAGLAAVEEWRREQEERARRRERAREREAWRSASPVALALREAGLAA